MSDIISLVNGTVSRYKPKQF